MAHTYAGILGPLAFLTSLARGVICGGGPESVLWGAWLNLLLFTAAGYLIGWVAGRIVEDSVRGRILAQLAAEQPDETPQPATSSTSNA